MHGLSESAAIGVDTAAAPAAATAAATVGLQLVFVADSLEFIFFFNSPEQLIDRLHRISLLSWQDNDNRRSLSSNK